MIDLKSLTDYDKFGLLFKIAVKKTELFLRSYKKSSDDLKSLISLLAVFLLLPAKIRKMYAHIESEFLIEKNKSINTALRVLRDDKMIISFLDLDSKELSKKLYMQSIYLKHQEKKYKTDLTSIKKLLKPIIQQLIKEGWESYEVTNLITDLFIFFKFENIHNQEYESSRKRIDMMLRRL